jgi:hypothetical protein
MADKERPLGVTIIGILWIIGGLLYLAGGTGLAFLAGPFGAGFGTVMVILGLIYILLGIGCFMAWPWVWTIGVILTIIGLLIGIASLFTTGFGALLTIIIAAIILYYLFQPHVRAYFSKA